MKKKLVAILLATVVSMGLVACGGDQEVGTTVENSVEVNGDYTEEQQALVNEYLELAELYDAATTKIEETPELAADTELVKVADELANEIIEVAEILQDPANLTEEVMAGLRIAFDETYVFIEQVNVTADLLPILTVAGWGVDEANNSYYFACDESISTGAFVGLSADGTENVKCVGEIVESGDTALTINDADGYTTTFEVEQTETGLVLTLQNGTVVEMEAAQPKQVIEAIVTIVTSTQNVNQ